MKMANYQMSHLTMRAKRILNFNGSEIKHVKITKKARLKVMNLRNGTLYQAKSHLKMCRGSSQLKALVF